MQDGKSAEARLPRPLFISDDLGDGDADPGDHEIVGIQSDGQMEYVIGVDNNWRTSLDLPLSPKAQKIYDRARLMLSVNAEHLTDFAGILKLAVDDRGFEAVIDVLIGLDGIERANLSSDFVAIQARKMMKELSNLNVISDRKFSLYVQNPLKQGLTDLLVKTINEKGAGWLVARNHGDKIEIKIHTAD